MIFLSYVCVCGAKADIRQNKPGGIKKNSFSYFKTDGR